VMLSSVVVVVMFGHIFPYQLTKQNAKLIHIAPLHYKNNKGIPFVLKKGG